MIKARSPQCRGGFSRLDLLVVLAAAGALSLVGFARAGSGRSHSYVAICLANFQGLIRGWQLYADDHSGRLVMAYHGGGNPGTNSPTWAQGWMDWTLRQDNTNTALLVDERYAKLGPYLAGDASLFKCPADTFLSLAQRRQGWSMRVRSVAGNIGIGDGNATTGPWGSIYKPIRKTSDFTIPGPSETWIHLEEHPMSINDPAFFNPIAPNNWVDLPATHHHGAASFTFADGHVELHAWRDSLSHEMRSSSDSYYLGVPMSSSPGDADIAWISYRAGRLTTQSY